MALLKVIATDLQKEERGVWTTYPGTDLELLVARIGNPQWESMSRKLLRQVRKERRKGELSEREAKQLLAPAVARCILLDWKNLEDEGPDGNPVPIPYSEAKALELLRDPRFKDLYEFVFSFANDGQAYTVDLEDDSK